MQGIVFILYLLYLMFFYLSACNRGLFKIYDCYVLILQIKKTLANLLVEKWVLLEVEGTTGTTAKRYQK